MLFQSCVGFDGKVRGQRFYLRTDLWTTSTTIAARLRNQGGMVAIQPIREAWLVLPKSAYRHEYDRPGWCRLVGSPHNFAELINWGMRPMIETQLRAALQGKWQSPNEIVAFCGDLVPVELVRKTLASIDEAEGAFDAILNTDSKPKGLRK